MICCANAKMTQLLTPNCQNKDKDHYYCATASSPIVAGRRCLTAGRTTRGEKVSKDHRHFWQFCTQI
jgi:hypothetical protein